MGGRVRRDNVWRSTLGSEQEADKDSAYAEWKKPRSPDRQPRPTASDGGAAAHDVSMLTAVSEHKQHAAVAATLRRKVSQDKSE